jgi:hypothetical protein
VLGFSEYILHRSNRRHAESLRKFVVVGDPHCAVLASLYGEQLSRDLGSGVGVEKSRKNLIGISLEFHENFKESACISDTYCIQSSEIPCKIPR